jgi:16S rRNA (guanine966-N2)-methyltransferase
MDTLRPWLSEARALDLFAGHGRFGISALEEGAAWVDFVEKDRKNAKTLQGDLGRWKEKSKVHNEDVFTYLESETQYDIIFADPPFPLWNETFTQKLFKSVTPRFSPGAIFLVKCPKRMVISPPLGQLSFWKDSTFGESRFCYYRDR